MTPRAAACAASITLALGACTISTTPGGAGSTTTGSCGFPGACGGDPTGTWNVVGYCYPAGYNPLGSRCPAATSTANIKVTGTASFNPDHTYQNTTTSSGSITVTIPASCLSGASSCDDVTQAIQQNGSQATCSGDITASCTCVTQESDTSRESGTWDVSGSTLTTVPANGNAPETSDLCVNGSTATARGTNGEVITFSK